MINDNGCIQGALQNRYMEDLENRLKKIEDRLNHLEQVLQNSSTSRAQSQEIQIPTPSKKSLPPPLPPRTSTPSPLLAWLKDNWMIAIGIFLVLLAMGWFVSYAFVNGWISEQARILFTFTAGLGLYISGSLILQRNEKAAQALIVLGQTVVMIAFFAGYQIYDLFSASTAFGIMTAFVFLTAVIAIRKELPGLGFAAVANAMIIPLLINTGQPTYLFLFAYILLIDAVALYMFTQQGWGLPFYLAWIATFLYTIFSFPTYPTSELLLFLPIFYFLFFTPAAIYTSTVSERKIPYGAIFLLSTTTIALIAWIEIFVPVGNWTFTWYLVAMMVSFFFDSRMAAFWEHLHKDLPRVKYVLAAILLYSGMGYMLLTTEWIPVDFSYDYKIALYFLECFTAIGVANFYFNASFAAAGLSVFFLIPLVLMGGNYPEILYVSFFSSQFMMLAIATISFGGAAWILAKVPNHPVFPDIMRFCIGFLSICAGILGMNVIWNISHNLFLNANLARGIALVAYIIAAEMLIYMGHAKQMKPLRWAGIAIIIFVVVRLLHEEVWQMPIVIRTVTFIITGALLIGTAFFDKKYRNKKKR